MDRRGENCRFHHFHAHFQHQVREFISHQSRAFHEYFLFKIKFSAPKARSITVEGLRPYTQYQLRLIAENVKGRGAPSEPSQAFEVSPDKKSKIREKARLDEANESRNAFRQNVRRSDFRYGNFRVLDATAGESMERSAQGLFDRLQGRKHWRLGRFLTSWVLKKKRPTLEGSPNSIVEGQRVYDPRSTPVHQLSNRLVRREHLWSERNFGNVASKVGVWRDLCKTERENR